MKSTLEVDYKDLEIATLRALRNLKQNRAILYIDTLSTTIYQFETFILINHFIIVFKQNI